MKTCLQLQGKLPLRLRDYLRLWSETQEDHSRVTRSLVITRTLLYICLFCLFWISLFDSFAQHKIFNFFSAFIFACWVVSECPYLTHLPDINFSISFQHLVICSVWRFSVDKKSNKFVEIPLLKNAQSSICEKYDLWILLTMSTTL
jgi:hypothetical protein